MGDRLLRAVFGLLALGFASAAHSFAITSQADGDWQTATSWAIITVGIPGTITSNTGTTTVSGTATQFTALQPGDRVLTNASVLIGTVASVTSNTSLTLTANAAVAVTNATYRLQKVPGAVDTVSIAAGHDITLNSSTPSAAAAASLTFVAAGAASSLTQAASVPLSITGDVTINSSTNTNGTRLWSIGAGSASVGGSVTLAQGSNNNGRIARINLSTGTLDIDGGLTMTAGNDLRAVINMTGGRINLAGAFTVNTQGTLTMGATAIFNFNGSVAQTIPVGVSQVIYSNLYTNNTSTPNGAIPSAAIATTNVTTSLHVESGIFSNNNLAIAGGAGDTFQVDNGAIFRMTGTAVFPTGFATYTFQPTSTVRYLQTSAQTVSARTYGHLEVMPSANNVTHTFQAGTTTVEGNLTVGNGTNTGVVVTAATNATILDVNGNVSISANTTLTANATQAFRVAGNWTRTGTFTPGAGAVTFDGASQQTITGATTFNNLVVDGAGLLLAANTTVSTTLTLTDGLIETTAAFAMVSTRLCNAAAPAAVVRTNGWVNGSLAKTIPAGASTCTFEVGDAITYAPTVLTFVAGTGTGLFVASTTGTEHPQIGFSGIDGTKSVNRYWTITNFSVTLPAAGYAAVFNFVNGSPLDFDAGANTANFIIERFTANTWFAATLGGACTPTPVGYLCKQASGLTNAAGVAGEFAIGEPASGFNLVPGDFSIFETTTTTGLIQGRIYTKLAGTTITLAVQAVNATRNGINAAYNTNPIAVALLDSSDNVTGSMTAATNCRTSWTVIQTQNLSPVWANGRATVTITAPTSAGQDVRVRVTQGALSGCSTDRFSIRPGFLRITSSANQTNSAGAPAIKTGADFTITAQGLRSDGTTAVSARYTGTPAIDNTIGMVLGSPNAGTIGGTFNAGTGVAATNTTFWYTEVGNFGLSTDAVVDAGFTTFDQPNDCVAGSTSNTLSGGMYGCSVGSIAVPFTLGTSGFGRFIPDNFNVSLNGPDFAASCGTFTYMGQAFFYGSNEPIMTVTARNGTAHGLTNAITRNYAGNYLKLDNTSLAPTAYDTQDERYKRFPAGSTPNLVTTGLPAVAADPLIAFPAASLTSGVGTLTFKSGTGGLTFARSTAAPSDAFDADISLELNVVDADGVAFAANPAKFGNAASGSGISFNGNKSMRYGRLRLLNAAGPTTVDIPLTLRAEYYVNATSGFILNADDNCTPLDAGYFRLSGHTGSLSGTNVNVSVPATLTSGVASGMKLTKATPPVSGPGSVRVCFDLDSAPAVGDTTCQRSGGSSVNRPYLQGPWSSAGTYDKDPAAQVNVGTFGAQPNNFIFFRENY